MNKDKLQTFVNRLHKIGISITMFGNYPWIYLDEINGQRVTEIFQADHGFTVAFLPLRPNEEIRFTDLEEIFRVIRKYVDKA